MAQEPRKWKVRATLLMLSLLSPFVVLSSPLKPWSEGWRAAHILQELVYPIEFVWHVTTNTITSSWKTYIDLANAAEDNLLLRREISLLQTRLLDYEEQVQETERLRQLLGFTQRFERNQLVAEVLGTPARLPYQSIRVSRGTSNGVQVGMPIVTAQGVVGRILRAGKNFSDVQLMTDGNFSLDVLLQRTRVRGVLHGYAGNSCQLKLSRRAEIRIGDTVVTSGIVGGFPKGLPVGRVMRISYEADNISQVITVEPWVDNRRLEEVVILLENDPDLQKIAETAGDDWLERSMRSPAGRGG